MWFEVNMNEDSFFTVKPILRDLQFDCGHLVLIDCL